MLTLNLEHAQQLSVSPPKKKFCPEKKRINPSFPPKKRWAGRNKGRGGAGQEKEEGGKKNPLLSGRKEEEVGFFDIFLLEGAEGGYFGKRWTLKKTEKGGNSGRGTECVAFTQFLIGFTELDKTGKQ